MIDPKNSLKDLKDVFKNTFTVLQKFIKVIPIKHAMKYWSYVTSPCLTNKLIYDKVGYNILFKQL